MGHEKQKLWVGETMHVLCCLIYLALFHSQLRSIRLKVTIKPRAWLFLGNALGESVAVVSLCPLIVLPANNSCY
jgi:hypothetical protein